MRRRRGDEPWWARIRQLDGAVLGAGVLLDPYRVLTCAHVIPDPDGEVLVEFVGIPGVRPATARVAEGCWFPPDDDQRGDLALLDLAVPAPEGCGAVLARPSLWNRAVYTRGFPALLDDGLWVQARLLGRAGPGGEWIQMDAEPHREIRPGFSGAPVVDDRTGNVLGIVVSEFTGMAGLAWMIPVETVVRYLADLQVGLEDDPSMTDKIKDFFGPGGSGGAMVVVTGDEPVSSAFDQPLDVQAPNEEDMSGKTVEEVSQWVERALARDSDGRLFVFDAVDAAADPEAVASEVIRPLTEAGHHVITGLRRESSELRRILDRPSVARRLEVLAARVAEATGEARAAREAHRQVARLVTPVPDWPDGGPALRLRVGALHRSPTVPELEACERQTEKLANDALEVRIALNDLHKEYNRLCGLLDSYHFGAGTERSERDQVLAELYAEAHQLLYARPCRLSAAVEAVDRYVHALRGGQ